MRTRHYSRRRSFLCERPPTQIENAAFKATRCKDVLDVPPRRKVRVDQRSQSREDVSMRKVRLTGAVPNADLATRLTMRWHSTSSEPRSCRSSSRMAITVVLSRDSPLLGNNAGLVPKATQKDSELSERRGDRAASVHLNTKLAIWLNSPKPSW